MMERGALNPTGGHGVAANFDIVFYDGHCGLCHHLVRFILAKDRQGIFRFAPLQGSFFRKTFSEQIRPNLPDSILLRTAAGEVLVHSTAAVYILKRLGGMWRITGLLLGWIPESLRDRAYRFIAAIRYRIFGRRETLCPLIPKDLQERFWL